MDCCRARFSLAGGRPPPKLANLAFAAATACCVVGTGNEPPHCRNAQAAAPSEAVHPDCSSTRTSHNRLRTRTRASGGNARTHRAPRPRGKPRRAPALVKVPKSRRGRKAEQMPFCASEWQLLHEPFNPERDHYFSVWSAQHRQSAAPANSRLLAHVAHMLRYSFTIESSIINQPCQNPRYFIPRATYPDWSGP